MLLDPCFEKAGLRLVKPQGLRHTFCSLCIEAGIDFKVISVWMGNSSIVTTMNIYGHLTQNNIDKSARSLEITIDGGT